MRGSTAGRGSARAAVAAAAAGAAVVLAGCGATGSSAITQVDPDAPRGEQVFIASGCGACHTLRDAGSTGTVGTDLDRASPRSEHVERFVTNGGVGMPSFEGLLSREDILAVARYVAEVSGW